MRSRISYEELLAAFEWVSAGEAAAIGCDAHVSKATGKIHWSGEGVDEALPEDIDDPGKYVAVPKKDEFDLGRALALRFIKDRLPHSSEIVHQYFSQRGAFSRFNALLERASQLEAWHEFERNAIEKALRQWSDEHGLTLTDLPKDTDG